MTVPGAPTIQEARRGANLSCPPLSSYIVEDDNENEDESDCSVFEDSSAIDVVASSPRLLAGAPAKISSELETREPELESTDWM